MNAVTLTVFALLFSADTGQISQVKLVSGFPNMKLCLEAAGNVIDMKNVLGVDCKWIKVNQKVWRISFGDKI